MIYDSEPMLVAELPASNIQKRHGGRRGRPEHIRFRRVFNASFAAESAGDGARMRERATELIDGFRGDSADLVADYAVPFVQAIIGAIIGFPAQDTAQIQAWTDDVDVLCGTSWRQWRHGWPRRGGWPTTPATCKR